VVFDVDLDVSGGMCLGILGESGSGKTTLLRCIAGLHTPNAGELRLEGAVLARDPKRRTNAQRRSIQLVPQNPDGSLNPRHTVGQIVGRPLRQFYGMRGMSQHDRVIELLDQVRLRPSMVTRLPRELSGGEKQRVAIARGLASQPRLLLCDEITSALDVVVQAGILELLQDLQRQLGMTMIFVSHDLAVIRSISDSVAVMRHGRIRETQLADMLFAHPGDDYTRELIDAVPRLGELDYPGGGQLRPLYGRS
jgi:peptide/nickel transport system ATP-binding protein